MRHALQLVPTSVHSRVAEVGSSKVDLRSAMRNDAGHVREVVLCPGGHQSRLFMGFRLLSHRS